MFRFQEPITNLPFGHRSISVLSKIFEVHELNTTIAVTDILRDNSVESITASAALYSMFFFYTDQLEETIDKFKQTENLVEYTSANVKALLANPATIFVNEKHSVLWVLQSPKNLLDSDTEQDPNRNIIVGLLPFFFSSLKKRLNKTELEAFKALVNNRYDLLAASLQKVKKLKKYKDYEYNKISTSLKDLTFKHKLARLENRKKECEEEVNLAASRLFEADRILRETTKELLFAKHTTPEQDDTVELLLKHKHLDTIEVKNRYLRMSFIVPLTNWDTEAIELVHRNNSNVLYKTFLDKIFIQEDAKYVLKAPMSIELTTFVYALRYAPDDPNTYGINPHVFSYNCLGSHRSEIERASRNHDLLVLIEAILNVYKNFNIADGAVSDSFASTIQRQYDTNTPCIEKNNKLIGLKDYIDSFRKEDQDV